MLARVTPCLDGAVRACARRRWRLLALLVATAGGCGGPESEPRFTFEAISLDNGLSTNGLSTNGASTNGLSTNGLSTNGLSTNGLSTNGLSTHGFARWFNGNPPAYSDMVMRYLVRCSLGEGESLSYTSTAGISYSWPGALGLAQQWAAGHPIPVAEQQLVSACLAAHANRYGMHVPISVRGHFADGSAIAIGPTEDYEYPVHEGCFFGNLFAGEGVFSGYDSSRGGFTAAMTSPRACAIDSCPPIVPTGACSDHCGPWTRTGYRRCRWSDVDYAPITTRLRRQDVYLCGDGICQFTESPYSRSRKTGCPDCGTIP